MGGREPLLAFWTRLRHLICRLRDGSGIGIRIARAVVAGARRGVSCAPPVRDRINTLIAVAIRGSRAAPRRVRGDTGVS